MLRIVRKFEINIQMLKEWGKEVRIESSERGVSNTRSLVDVAQGINEIKNNMVRVLDQLTDAKSFNEELKENVCKFEGMITEMHSVNMDNYRAKN